MHPAWWPSLKVDAASLGKIAAPINKLLEQQAKPSRAFLYLKYLITEPRFDSKLLSKKLKTRVEKSWIWVDWVKWGFLGSSIRADQQMPQRHLSIITTIIITTKMKASLCFWLAWLVGRHPVPGRRRCELICMYWITFYLLPKAANVLA